MNNRSHTAPDFTVGDLRAHKRLCRTIAGVSSFLMLTTMSAPAFAGTPVLGGDATLTGATRAALNTGSATDAYAQFIADAGAKSAVLDWSKFNVGTGKEMNFSGAGTTFFNLVDATASKSQIDGLIKGNTGSESVWVINPNGIAFGASSQVNVGGLFAAAAGNVSNADDLRNETATLPVFSSFAGDVTSESGAKFTADQVALLGKTVSVAGDMAMDFGSGDLGVSDLTIGAAKKLTVDSVAGGRVAVSVADFATSPSEASVELGDLRLGDTTYGYYGGDLTVRAGNAVKVAGDVQVGGTAYLTTKNGNVSVEQGANLESVGMGGMVNVITGMSEGGRGDIDIAGTIKADGFYGSTTLYAGYGVAGIGGAGGDITIKGSASADVSADIQSLRGGVTVAQDGGVTVADGAIQLVATGDVAIDGQVANATSYGEKISVQSYGGSITVGEKGTVVSRGEQGAVQVVAGIGDGETGNVKVDGSVKAEGVQGFVWLASGYGEGSKGVVTVAGEAKAGSVLSVDGKDGIDGAGTFDAAGAQLQLTADNGAIEVTGKALSKEAFLNAKGGITLANKANDFESVQAEGASVTVYDADTLKLDTVTAKAGNVTISTVKGDLTVKSSATVSTQAEDSDVALLAGRGDNAEGSVVVNGTVRADKKGSTVYLYGGNGTDARGGVTVNGTVSAVAEGEDKAGGVVAYASVGVGAQGDVVVASGAKVETDSAATLYAGFGLGYGQDAEASGDVSISGDVHASDGIHVASFNGKVSGMGNLTTEGDLVAASYTGDLALQGTVKAENATLMAEFGMIKVNGAGNDFSGKVRAVAKNDITLADANDMTVSSAMSEAGTVFLQTVDGKLTAEGVVSAGKDVKIYTGSGDISLQGEVSSLGAGSKIDIVAGVSDKGVGSVETSGGILGKSIELSGVDGVLVSGDVKALAGGVKVSSANGGIAVARGATVQSTNIQLGSYDLGSVALLAGTSAGSKGDITIDGTVKADGNYGSVYVGAACGDASKGNVVVGVEGKISSGMMTLVGAGYDSDAQKTGGNGGVTVNGAVESAGSAYVLGASGNDLGIDVTGTVAGNTGVTLATSDAKGIKGAGTIDAGSGTLTVYANGGAIDLSGVLTGTAADLSAKGDINAKNVGNDFDVVEIASGASVNVVDKDDVVLSDVAVKQGEFSLTAMSGGITQMAGSKILAQDANLTASEGIYLLNDGNDFTGSVTARGYEVNLYDCNDLTLGDISAVGYVTMYEGRPSCLGVFAESEGKLQLKDGAVVKTTGDGAGITLQSDAETVQVDGTVRAEGELSQISLVAAGADGTSGDVVINGSVSAEGELSELIAQVGAGRGSSGDIVVEGDVRVAGFARMAAGHVDGDVTVGKAATVNVSGDNSELTMNSGYQSGIVDIAGDIVVSGAKSAISANGVGMAVSGDVAVSGESSQLWLVASSEKGYEGDLNVAGNVSIEGMGAVMVLRAADGENAKGDINIEETGRISASGDGAALVTAASFGKNASGNVKINGRISLAGGNNLYEGGSGLGEGASGSVEIAGTVEARDQGSTVLLNTGSGENSTGSISVSGSILANGGKSRTELVASNGKNSSGSVSISGAVSADGEGGMARAYAGYGEGASGSVVVERSGRLSADGKGGEALVLVGYGAGASGDITVNGEISTVGEDGVASLVGGFGKNADGSVTVNGEVKANATAQIRTVGGDVAVNGQVSSMHNADVWVAKDANGGGGDIAFSDKGSVVAGGTINVVADGNVTQEGVILSAQRGVMPVGTAHAALTADKIVFGVGGSVGQGDSYVGVKGKVYGVIDGSASIAAAEGSNFQGGEASGAPSVQKISKIEQTVSVIDKDGKIREDKVTIDGIEKDFSELGGTSSVLAKGDLSVYTTGKLEQNGLLKAGGDITVSASKFGDVSYLQAGGLLTINNVGKPVSPRIAYFESVNGREPAINNQPNDTVIFVDGRLAGGNLKILNQFGANEAFLVQTPELKSTQGIFGNPTFLHSDLDVANPMEVSAIDYMLQETPRLTLDKDFPKEADQHVDSVVIPEKDSIQFGREAKNDSAPVADDKVAMLH